MKLQISVSAASLLTPFGKQVRALESQAAKARKLFDAAKEAEAAGKNIDTRVARLKEVLGGSSIGAKNAPAVKPQALAGAGPKGFYVLLATTRRDSDRILDQRWARAKSINDAAQIVREYKKSNQVGASSWMGGMLIKDGRIVGSLSANGRYSDDLSSEYLTRYSARFLRLFKDQMSSTSSTSSGNEKYGSSRWVYLAKSGKVGTWREAPSSRGQASDIVRDYVDSNGLTDASFTGGLLIEDGDIIGRIMSNGKFVHIESDHAGMKDYLKRAGNAAMAIIRG